VGHEILTLVIGSLVVSLLTVDLIKLTGVSRAILAASEEIVALRTKVECTAEELAELRGRCDALWRTDRRSAGSVSAT
jgi:hypothetical protein